MSTASGAASAALWTQASSSAKPATPPGQCRWVTPMTGSASRHGPAPPLRKSPKQAGFPSTVFVPCETGTVSLPGLGPLESAVMDVMWCAREPITGRTCLNRLDYQTCYGEEPSYNAVMLILANLGKKRL